MTPSTPAQLIGTWHLEEHSQLSAQATGVLIYSSDGGMSVLIIGSPPAPADSGKIVIAYSGGFSVGGDLIRHTVKVSDREDRISQVYERQFAVDKDRLTLVWNKGPGDSQKIVWRRK